jgi:hypothetical protein
MSVTQTLGRLLIATILISSAYHHLSSPDTYTELFIKNYNHIVNATSSFASGVLPASATVSFKIILVKLEFKC